MAKPFLTRLNATALFWLEALSRPRQIGAVAPSSRGLAIAMARWVPADRRAWILELGPGTGSVTRALLERGHAPDRLVAIEMSSKMADLLRDRFAGTQIVTGDALDLDTLLGARGCKPGELAAVFSSLPLVNFEPAAAERLAQKIQEALQPGGLYVQYTYHFIRKPPAAVRRFQLHASQMVWLNLPPACVRVYRKT